MMKRFLALFFLVQFIAVACEGPVMPVVDLAEPEVAILQFTRTPTATLTPEPTLTPTINPPRTIAPTIPPSPTPDPFLFMTIESLAARTYGGGVLEDLGVLNSTSANFSRRLFRYRSEGLNMYGFINIPDGDGTFPVILMLHGYVEPAAYNTLDYSVRYADDLAEAGYILLHPNLRGYSPSPNAENALGIGDTIDTLNLLALVRQFSGIAGLLEKADASRVGLWGHSMGGGIVLRVLVLDPQISAAILYASINADEKVNLAHFEKDGRGNEKLPVPAAALKQISPLDYLEQIDTPVSIHHGDADAVVPVEWSEVLCEFLGELAADVECVIYEGQPHTFKNAGDTKFMSNAVLFFEKHMK